jgi:cytoskeletal protein CcmA (bactofilin family)
MPIPARLSEPRTEAPRGGNAIIGKSAIIKGEIYGDEDLIIDGEVEGTVELQEHRLTIGPNGRVNAAVKAREVVVLGTLHGNVEARDKLEIRKDAKLVGDIRTARIVIEDGAYFKGTVDIVRAETHPVAAPKPPSVANWSALEKRYGSLVEKKYLGQLSQAEEVEMEDLSTRLSAADADFYEAIVRRLRTRGTLADDIAVRGKSR